MNNLKSFNDTILQKIKTIAFNATELQIFICEKSKNCAKEHLVPEFFKVTTGNYCLLADNCQRTTSNI